MEKASSILKFYFEHAWLGAGLKWDYLNNSGEIDQAVEAIINAAVAKAKEELKNERE